MNNAVLLIRYDGGKPRVIESSGKPCPMFPDGHGNHIYIVDNPDVAARLATENPNKYRLFKSKSFDYKHTTPNGTSKWIRPVPWSYREETRDVGADERGERQFKSVLVWFEDKEEKFAIPATEEAVTGKPAKAAMSIETEMQNTLKENAKLKETIAAMEKRFAEQDKKIEALIAQMSGAVPPGEDEEKGKPGRPKKA